MTEEKRKLGKKITPDQFEVKFNAGAAYALATGDILGGMGYVFHQSKDLSNEPIIQRVLVGSQKLQEFQEEYNKKLQKWKGSKDENRGMAPEPKIDEKIALAQMQHQELIYSAQVRTEMFKAHYDNLTVSQAKNMTLHGRTLKNIPETIDNLIIKNESNLVKKVENETLKDSLKAFKRYYVSGITAQNVQNMYLEKTLEHLAKTKKE